jgi:hypothetical protein
MLASIWFFRSLGIHWGFLIPLSGGIYVAMVLVTKALQPDERAFIMTTLSPASVRRMFSPQKSSA